VEVFSMIGLAMRIRGRSVAILSAAALVAPGAALADTPPQITFYGSGGALQGGWLKGAHSVYVRAQDDIGVARVELWIDNVLRDWRDFSAPVQDQVAEMLIDTAVLNDGQHTIDAVAADTAGQRSAYVEGPSRRRILIDNTPPSAPHDLKLAGGSTWRSTNSFTLTWINPGQAFAPISGAAWAICPAANGPDDPTGCVQDWRGGSNGGELGMSRRTLEVPRPGAWKVWLWLMDAALNHDARFGAGWVRLGFDPDPPELTILEQDSNDPARLRVQARDATSSVARGEIEIRRQGERTWQSLPTELGAGGFSAFADDSELPDGVYDVRARAVDEAGNERSADRRETGEPATITLPARVKTRLVVGKVRRVRAKRSHGGKRRYRRVLVARPRARFGRAVHLHGRLTTPGANPVADAELEVSEQVKLPGAGWRRIGLVKTSRTGRFTFRAPRGPSRVIRFRYPGTPTIRARTAEVDLRVRATTSFRVNRHNVVNGEEVTFRGRLKGRPLPDASKLVQLQVYSRRRWGTFAIARANRRTGLWSHRYRFEATRGRVRYRFRVRVPQESGYPYATGTSQQVRVTVRGL
jgi:hypothetical protein